MQIKQMEDQLGLVVIEQVGKRFALTEAGQELRVHAKKIGSQTAEMAAAMEQFRGLERGLLRIAVVSTANYFLPPLIAHYSSAYPGVRVSLNVANREAVLSAVSSNEVEFAITGQPPERIDVVSQPFMDNPLVAIASPQHPLAALRSIDPGLLADEILVPLHRGFDGLRWATPILHQSPWTRRCRDKREPAWLGPFGW